MKHTVLYIGNLANESFPNIETIAKASKTFDHPSSCISRH